MALSRRRLLRGFSLATGALIRVGLPPLEAMFNPSGTAYAAESELPSGQKIESRLLFWFNGNGIPERYFRIPASTGPDYELTPCLVLPAFRCANTCM